MQVILQLGDGFFVAHTLAASHFQIYLQTGIFFLEALDLLEKSFFLLYCVVLLFICCLNLLCLQILIIFVSI